jgi:Flp pilus assembly protein TadD
VARRRGDMKEWRYQLEKALEIDPKSPDPLNSMGAWHIANDDPEKALDYLNQALQSPYYHPQTHGGFVHENMGYAYIALDKIPEAERELTKAVELDPHQFTAVRTLLELAVMRKDTKVLADRLRRARWLFPEPNAVLDMYAGLAASFAGDHVRAEQLLGRALMALDRAPADAGGIQPLAWGWHALARSLAFLGRGGESVQIVKRFLAMSNLPAAERQMFLQLAQELQGRGR